MFKWGEQELERILVSFGLLMLVIDYHETDSSISGFTRLFCLVHAENRVCSAGVTAWSGTRWVSHVSDKQWMVQSLMSRWNFILALKSSNLFSKDWTFEAGYRAKVVNEPVTIACFVQLHDDLCASFYFSFGSRFYVCPRPAVFPQATTENQTTCQ